MKQMLKKIQEKLIYEDKWLSFYQDEIELPDGEVSTYAWVKRNDGVAVIVLTPDREILLQREFRHIIQDYSWEIQGGGIEGGESAAEAAVRELAEEAGINVPATKLEKLAVFYPLHSLNTERVILFLLEIEKPVVSMKNQEAGELIEEQKFVSFEEALRMIDEGEINDVFTANAIQMAIRRVKHQ